MKDKKAPAAPLPERVIRTEVSRVEVGKYYLKAELCRVFPGPKSFRKTIDSQIDSIDGLEFWRLFEALSFAYRLNYVFHYVGNSGYSWNEERWSITNLTLTGTNPEINAVTYSSEIERSPLKFCDYLKKYFFEHPKDDPQNLGQFRPEKKAVFYPKILLREEDGKILLLDGSNRLISLMFAGKESVEAFVGRKNGKEEKPRIGDSTFLLLRNLYVNSDEKVKAATIKVTRKLIEMSTDGKGAVENYWIRHPSDEALRKVGRMLIAKQKGQ